MASKRPSIRDTPRAETYYETPAPVPDTGPAWDRLNGRWTLWYKNEVRRSAELEAARTGESHSAVIARWIEAGRRATGNLS